MKSVIIPKWALDLVFYGDSGILTPSQLKAVDALLDSLEGYQKTPDNYQNVGIQPTNDLNDKPQACYQLFFKAV